MTLMATILMGKALMRMPRTAMTTTPMPVTGTLIMAKMLTAMVMLTCRMRARW